MVHKVLIQQTDGTKHGLLEWEKLIYTERLNNINTFEITIPGNKAQDIGGKISIYDKSGANEKGLIFIFRKSVLRLKGPVESIGFDSQGNLVISGSGTEVFADYAKTDEYKNTGANNDVIVTELVALVPEINIGTIDAFSGNPLGHVQYNEIPVVLGLKEVVNKVCNQDWFINYQESATDTFEVRNFKGSSTSVRTLVDGIDIQRVSRKQDARRIINSVKVIGAGDITATASDATSQSKFGIRKFRYINKNIFSATTAQDIADTIIAQNKDPVETIGFKVDDIDLALQTGDKVTIHSPKVLETANVVMRVIGITRVVSRGREELGLEVGDENSRKDPLSFIKTIGNEKFKTDLDQAGPFGNVIPESNASYNLGSEGTIWNIANFKSIRVFTDGIGFSPTDPIVFGTSGNNLSINTSAQINMGFTGGNKRIINTADPINPQDVATKNYVDSGAGGVTGSGTINRIPIWTASTTMGDSGVEEAVGAFRPVISLSLGDASNQWQDFHTVKGTFSTAVDQDVLTLTKTGIGIGTVLDINNSGTGDSININAGPINAASSMASFSQVNIGASGTDPLHVAGKARITGDLSVGAAGQDLFVDDSTARVGIGTTGPNETLHVFSATDALVKIHHSSNFNDTGVLITHNNLDKWRMVVGTGDTGAALRFRDPTTDRVIFESGGGITSGGHILPTAGGFNMGQIASPTWAALYLDNFLVSSATTTTTVDTNGFNLVVDLNSALTRTITFQNSGVGGITFDAPTANSSFAKVDINGSGADTLHVAGTSTVTGNATFQTEVHLSVLNSARLAIGHAVPTGPFHIVCPAGNTFNEGFLLDNSNAGGTGAAQKIIQAKNDTALLLQKTGIGAGVVFDIINSGTGDSIRVGSGNINCASSLGQFSQLNVNASGPETLFVSGTGRITGALTVNGNIHTDSSLTVDDPVTFASTLNVASTTTLTGDLNVDGAKIRVTEQATPPATPPAGKGFIYEKTDNLLYFKNDAGTEFSLTSGGVGGSGTVNRHAVWTASSTLGDSLIEETAGAFRPTGSLTIGDTANRFQGLFAVSADLVGTNETIRMANVTTNLIEKTSRISNKHFTNAEEDFNLVHGNSGAAQNTLNLGGGTSLQNAATEIKMWAAANQITLTGTNILTVTTSSFDANALNAQFAKVDINGSGADTLHVAGTMNVTGNSFIDALKINSTSTIEHDFHIRQRSDAFTGDGGFALEDNLGANAFIHIVSSGLLTLASTTNFTTYNNVYTLSTTDFVLANLTALTATSATASFAKLGLNGSGADTLHVVGTGKFTDKVTINGSTTPMLDVIGSAANTLFHLNKTNVGGGNVINIDNAGTGNDIRGAGGTWEISPAGKGGFVHLQVDEIAAPATPAAGTGLIYEKTDNLLYFKNDLGTEFDLTAGGGGGVGGSGTVNVLPKWVGTTTLGDSLLIEEPAGTIRPNGVSLILGNAANRFTNIFTSAVDSSGTVTCANINTGIGVTEVHLMNQNVRTTDAVTFATVNTGQGATEVHLMNQNIRTTDSPTFANLTLTSTSLSASSATASFNIVNVGVSGSQKVNVAGGIDFSGNLFKSGTQGIVNGDVRFRSLEPDRLLATRAKAFRVGGGPFTVPANGSQTITVTYGIAFNTTPTIQNQINLNFSPGGRIHLTEQVFDLTSTIFRAQISNFDGSSYSYNLEYMGFAPFN